MSRTGLLGAFIFAALLIFTAATFLIGKKQFLFSHTYKVHAAFDNVAGLEEGATVRAGGVRIGTVERILLPNQPGEKMKVELKLEQETHKVLRRDSIAAIETEGMLGSKYVALSFGTPQGQAIRDGDTIQGRPPFDFADVAKKATVMIDAAREAIDSSKVAIGHLNEATDDIKSITGKIDGGKGTIGALINDESTYRNLNATTASLRDMVGEARTGIVSFQENMEALKHNFFLRGFFKDRGYFDASDLTAHTVANLPEQPPLKQFVFAEKDIFDKPDNAKLKNEKRLNAVGTFLEANPFGLVVIVARTGERGEKQDNLQLSQARAMVVRQYLVEKFKIDETRVKTLGLGETPQAQSTNLDIVIYPSGVVTQATEAKNK
jgi:phospholipid/cholesterol/gamma-HCH transport system substrate-binding protein